MGRYIGVFAAVSAFCIWGFLPIYWKHLGVVPSFEVLCHRMAWSLLFTGGAILLCRRGSILLQELKNFKTLKTFTLSAILLGGNWLLYIWAVTAGYIVEASLGYFINPLINVFLGYVFFGERLRKTQCGALLFAVGGVLFLTLYYGQFPWIALTLGISFAIYGVVHKKSTVATLDGLCIETMVLFLPAVLYLVYQEYIGAGHFYSAGSVVTLLLIGTGVVTSLPLLLFGLAAHRLPLSTIGLFQYIAPSINLCIGIYLYNEAFPLERFVGFFLIWLGLFLYMGEGIYRKIQSKHSLLT